MGNLAFNEFPRSTAQVLRLAEPWKGTYRVLSGDSAFASVATAHALHNRLKLHFRGCVKRAHKRFPRAYLRETVATMPRGSHIAVSTEYQGVPMLGVAWKDKTIKTYVSTTGNALPGDQLVRKRQRVVGEREEHYTTCVDRPQLVQDYHEAANAIDVHNHYRQSGLALETGWKTKTWWHRTLATILGMIEVDAFLAYKHFKDKDIEHSHFTGMIIDELVFNHYDSRRRNVAGTPVVVRSKRRKQPAHVHQMGKLRNLPHFEDKAQARLRCRECSERCLTYCKSCSKQREASESCKTRDIFALHDSSAGKGCYENHLSAFTCYEETVECNSDE